MRYIKLVFFCIILSSCDFNINNYPGPQISTSIKASKEHGTFICAYDVKNKIINGIGIDAIFAEKQSSREQGLLSIKDISCCKSQLIILSSNEPFSTDKSGYSFDWKITGFVFPSPTASVIYRYYNGTLFPDSIPITIVAIKGKDSTQVIKRVTLYKIN